jgi:hypothetical protein
MLEDIISQISSISPSHWIGVDSAPSVLPLSYICSGVGGLILSRFTGNIGNLTIPLNCAALLIGATVANALTKGVDLPIDHQVQQPMLVSLSGMLAAALLMMLWNRRSSMR